MERAILVVPTEKINIVTDQDDNKFVEAAVEGEAQYIISKDKHLLILKEYRGIKVLHPDDFLGLLV